MSKNSTIRREEIRIQIGISLRTVSLRIMSGRITAARPKISSTFKIFEPITLPSTMSVCPDDNAFNEIASSGADVPNAIIVRPIKVFGTLKFDAVDDAPSTNQSAPLINRTNPAINNTICSAISILLFQ